MELTRTSRKQVFKFTANARLHDCGVNPISLSSPALHSRWRQELYHQQLVHHRTTLSPVALHSGWRHEVRIVQTKQLEELRQFRRKKHIPMDLSISQTTWDTTVPPSKLKNSCFKSPREYSRNCRRANTGEMKDDVTPTRTNESHLSLNSTTETTAR